jgi:hypothetical protein
MRQPTIHQMREKKKSSRKSQGSRKVTVLLTLVKTIPNLEIFLLNSWVGLFQRLPPFTYLHIGLHSYNNNY